MITSEQIIKVNRYLTPGNSYKFNLIESALSSYDYYDSVSDKISSIFRGLIKNHPFSDGNKRTAIVILFYLSDEYNLKLINDRALEEAIIKIASSNIDVNEISNMIYLLNEDQMRIKSFKQFLNEFEIEGEHQQNNLHYYLVNYYNNSTDGEFRYGENIVSKLSLETLEHKKQAISALFVEVVEISYSEAIEDHNLEDWYYIDEKGKETGFDINTNEVVK